MFLRSFIFVFALLFSSFDKSLTQETDANAVPGLQDLFHGVQSTLAMLHTKGGMPGPILSQRATEIAKMANQFLSDRGVTIPDDEIKDLITEEASQFNNLASMTALFDDALSLEAAKLDSAFYLWDRLSKIIVDEASSEEKVAIAVAALEKTSLAVADAVTQTTDIFHFLVDSDMSHVTDGPVTVTRRRRETTVTGTVEHGPGGTSVGISISHTFRRKRNIVS